jgi:adenylate kinase family enzyme
MKIINLLGGPGVGKSTVAAGLFYELKSQGLEVEYVTEYAKDLTWENRHNILEDQLYVFAKQHRKLARLLNHKIDWVITDSPLLLSLVYVNPQHLSSNFHNLVLEIFNKYENFNFLLKRNVQYNPIGRNQDEYQSLLLDQKIRTMLYDYHITYTEILGGNDAVHSILSNPIFDL